MIIHTVIFMLMGFLYNNASVYRYPIEKSRNVNPFYMCQKRNENTLCIKSGEEWNSLLAPWYNPAYVRLSPNRNAVSFIDSGRIRIKEWQKRFALSLELSLDLYNIRSVDWIDQDLLLVNGMYKKQFGIFYINLEGEIITSIISNTYDLLFPQVYKKNTYYISSLRKENKSLYGIGSYFEKDFSSIILPQNNILSFLHMNDDQSGFVLSCDSAYFKKEIILFDINQLKYQENKWALEKLCSFSVPQIFLDPKSTYCFFEGMLPLLPIYTDEFIYFINIVTDEKGHTFLYVKYDMQSGEILEQNDDEIVNRIEVIDS